MQDPSPTPPRPPTKNPVRVPNDGFLVLWEHQRQRVRGHLALGVKGQGSGSGNAEDGGGTTD